MFLIFHIQKEWSLPAVCKSLQQAVSISYIIVCLSGKTVRLLRQ